MPIERKPLFRPEVIHQHVQAFELPRHVNDVRPRLVHWADLIASRRADKLNEKELLPDFLSDFFVSLLGYTRPADGGTRYTLSREKHVQVDGKFADAVLGDFNGHDRPVLAVEGKNTKDPLDRPYAGRKLSAVQQGYQYAINLTCDWIIVTSMRQTRLYYKGADTQTYELFDAEALADNENLLRKFVFLLGAQRVVPEHGRCHLHDLLNESEKVGRELTKKFYVQYGDIRQDAFCRLCQDNPEVPPKAVLASTQKLLDRVLFCAFAEDRGLLPVETIRQAYEHRDPYHPRPIYDNFRGLFQAINRGNAALGIHAYNGGLFAEDPGLDSLRVSDEVCGYFRDLGDYEYRPAHQTVLVAGGNCGRQAAERYELQTKVQRRLLQAFGEDAAGAARGRLNQKAQRWWTLSLNELGQALKTSFKLRTSPFKDPRLADQWEPYLIENRQSVDRLTRALADAEADLNDRVYALFQLTPHEIKLLQREVEH